MATILTCLSCGEAIRLSDRFCSRCGDELTLSSHPTALVDTAAHPDDDPESPWAEVVHRLRRATFGEFEIGRELGRGGMAAVFLAHDVSLDRKVAIKVMSPGLLMGAGMIERFRREAITIAHLNHPNIVSCYSVRQAEGLHFFVMRYIRGRSLEQVLQDAGRLPVPIVRSIVCQVGSALTYAHRSRVVHRDIKPANILIDEDGNAVVTDFGIAKVAELPGSTHSGALVGTPAYMSPEQCSGTEVSGATDQYSLGAVAYEMLTGEAPFTGSTLTVMQAQVENPPAPIRDRVPECPPELESAILRMLAKNPDDRFPSMAEAKAALGATPLREDDPLLGQLSRLASAGAAEPSTPIPVSPVPSAGASSAVRSAIAGQARSIVILPPPAELARGDSFALVVLVRGERGTPLPGRTVEWSTDAPDVLHLDRTRNVATAVAPGIAVLTASCDGIQTRVQVSVPPAVMEPFDAQADGLTAAIQVSAPPKSVRVGDSFVLTATPLDGMGRPLPEPAVLWSSSDVRVAVVTAEGWVAALGRGPVVLTATRGGASGSVTINVEPAIPARRPGTPIQRERRAAQPAQPAGPETANRSTWRRRGARSRRALVRGTVGLAAIAVSLWFFGGLRDFRWDRGLPWVLARDTAPTATDTTPPAQPAESIAPINRGAAALNREKPRLRRAAQPRPPAVESLGVATRQPVTTGAAGRPAVLARDTGTDLGADSGTSRPAGDSQLTAESVLSDTSAYAPPQPGVDREEPSQEAAPPPATPPPAESRLATPPPTVRTAPDPPVDRRQLESRIREGLDDCYGAVRSKDLDRLAQIYHPKTYADDEKLKRLTRILRTEPWKAAVGKRVDGVREMGAKAAAAEFSFRLTWRNALGGRLSSHPIFRAEFARDTNGWSMSSCRIVGSPKL
jgi:serine/threonine protein kinase